MRRLLASLATTSASHLQAFRRHLPSIRLHTSFLTSLAKTSTAKDQLASLLKESYGYRSFRPLQRPSLEALRDGRDLCIVMATGGGKSLIYNLGARVRGGTAVVITPLISLMEDQASSAQRDGFRAHAFHSRLSKSKKETILSELSRGEVELLFLCPESITFGSKGEEEAEALITADQLDGGGGSDCTTSSSGILKTIPKIALVAVDEAHCVSLWGHDFRPAYRKVGKVVNKLRNESAERFPIAALTATATPSVREDITSSLGLNSPKVLVGNFERVNLEYSVVMKPSSWDLTDVGLGKSDAERTMRSSFVVRSVISLAAKYGIGTAAQQGKGVVYVLQRRHVTQLVEALQMVGIQCKGYHAGMHRRERTKVLEEFTTGDLPIVVATVAFGMGIHRDDVRFVLHTTPSPSLETYAQEAGRAGRDGKPASCMILARPNDFGKLRALHNSNPYARMRKEKIDSMIDDVYRYSMLKNGCRHHTLASFFGQESVCSPTERLNACDWCNPATTIDTSVAHCRKAMRMWGVVEESESAPLELGWDDYSSLPLEVRKEGNERYYSEEESTEIYDTICKYVMAANTPTLEFTSIFLSCGNSSSKTKGVEGYRRALAALAPTKEDIKFCIAQLLEKDIIAFESKGRTTGANRLALTVKGDEIVEGNVKPGSVKLLKNMEKRISAFISDNDTRLTAKSHSLLGLSKRQKLVNYLNSAGHPTLEEAIMTVEGKELKAKTERQRSILGLYERSVKFAKSIADS
uniref:DNA 3'-5' helicase n=1 Tax=Palpitomonas bilix TaxID=652834 RepID=A0A7S3GDY4_9EUKA